MKNTQLTKISSLAKPSTGNFVQLLFLSFALCLGLNAQAYLTIAESGEVLPMNQYQVGVEPQLLLNHGGGMNANFFADAPLNESTSARVSLGFGSVEFNTMASVKYIPFPDVDRQPSIGLRAGVGIARDSSQNIILGQLAPLISKKVEVEKGLLIPYVAIPFEMINTKSETFSSSQFVFGSEFITPEYKQARFGAEIGLETNRSYSYVSVFASFPFESSKGLFSK